MKTVTLLCLALAASSPAFGLAFTPLKIPDIGDVLWVHDCGLVPKEKCVPDVDDCFAEGDTAKLAGWLQRRRFAEIWLNSGGGDLDEGIQIATLLRKNSATVRVPFLNRYVNGLERNVNSCVSACTVAFLGGWFRTVDSDARYEVHSASRYMSDGRRIEAIYNRVLEDPVGELQRRALEMRKDERELAMRLFLVCQGALLRDHNPRFVAAGPPEYQRQQISIPYLTDPTLTADAERIRHEGKPAVQQIMMRLERDFMSDAIDDIEKIKPVLGERTGPALAMLRAMYSSRITMTAELSPQTLLEMGYVTRTVPLTMPQ